jgi:hypothetical protein
VTRHTKKGTMARSLPRGDARPAVRPWSPEEAAEFAARRDFRLVQLLASDRSAFRAARRLGVFGARSPAAARSGARTQMQDSQTDRSGQQQRRGATSPSPMAPQLNSAQRRSARRRETWWQGKLSSISAGTQASQARSTSMVQEMRGLLHEMQHAAAAPGEPPVPALLDAPMAETGTAADAGAPAEPAAAAVAESLQTRATTAEDPGGSPAAAQTRAMELSPPNSPPSSPPSATGRQEAELLREASDTLAARSAQRRNGDAESLCPLPRATHARALAARGKGGGRGAGRPGRR